MTGKSLALALIFASQIFATRATEPEPQRLWLLQGLEDKKPLEAFLNYGMPETDDSFGGFSCRIGSGVVKLWIAETSEKLKPGKKATAVLAIGETKTSVNGKLMPNEEAGVPSFDGRMKADDPIFEAMADGKEPVKELAATVGPSTQTAPLKGAADKVRKFLAACAKR